MRGHELVEKIDINGDGLPDAWKVWVTPDDPRQAGGRGRVLVRKEVDLNFDGRVDLRTHYDINGDIVREEANLDFDGEFDAVDHYEGGRLVLRDITLSQGQGPRIWKFYEDGRLVRKERSDSGSGRPNVWEYYANGVLTRVGYDTTGDGQPDRFQESR